VLKKAFDAFDREKSGSISTNMVEEILRLMGQPFNRNTLEELIDEVDADSKYTRDCVRFEVFTAATMKNVFWDIKTQFVPHRRHITSPLQSPAS
jgi:Ca2+-binding EF-hand superfamily protein